MSAYLGNLQKVVSIHNHHSNCRQERLHPKYIIIIPTNMKEIVKHCWGGTHMSAYLGNLQKVVSIHNHHSNCRQERGSTPSILLLFRLI